MDTKPALFALCIPFASALLVDAGLPEAMIFNFFASTSTGKTTIIKVAASVFGNPLEFLGWRQSPSKMDEVAMYHHDNTLILDDIETNIGNLQQRMKDAYEVIHTLTAGKPRGISRLATGAGTRESYSCITLSSSPASILWGLMDHVELQDSDRVRLLEIPVPETDFGVWDPSVSLARKEPPQNRQQTEALAQNASSNFGTAGKRWIDYLTEHQSELGDRISETTKKFAQQCKTVEPKKGRIAAKVGLVLAAGEMAVEAKILPCSKLDVQRACRWAYNEIIETAFGHELDIEEIVEDLSDRLEDEFFPEYSQAEISANAKLKDLEGFVNNDNEKVIMTANGFERLCDDLLPTSSAARARMLIHIRKELTAKRIYLTDPRGNHIQSVNIAKNGQRRWVIDLAQLLSFRDRMQPEPVTQGKRAVQSKRKTIRTSKTSRTKPRQRKSRSEQLKRRPNRKSRN